MKKTFLVLTATLTLLTTSCKNNTEASGEAITSKETAESKPATVVGTWLMTDFDLGKDIPKEQQEALDAYKKEMIDKKETYTFNEDGTMTHVTPLFDEPETGTYIYADNKLTLTNAKTKKEETATVEELTSDKMVLSVQSGKEKYVMTYTKQ